MVRLRRPTLRVSRRRVMKIWHLLNIGYFIWGISSCQEEHESCKLEVVGSRPASSTTLHSQFHQLINKCYYRQERWWLWRYQCSISLVVKRDLAKIQSRVRLSYIAPYGGLVKQVKTVAFQAADRGSNPLLTTIRPEAQQIKHWSINIKAQMCHMG